MVGRIVTCARLPTHGLLFLSPESVTFPQDLLDKKEALWPWFKAQTRTWIFLQRGF